MKKKNTLIMTAFYFHNLVFRLILLIFDILISKNLTIIKENYFHYLKNLYSKIQY